MIVKLYYLLYILFQFSEIIKNFRNWLEILGCTKFNFITLNENLNYVICDIISVIVFKD